MGLLEIIAAILIIAWLGGFALDIAGDAIHVLLVIAVVVFVLRFFRRAV
jgi:hypothetical protein